MSDVDTATPYLEALVGTRGTAFWGGFKRTCRALQDTVLDTEDATMTETQGAPKSGSVRGRWGTQGPLFAVAEPSPGSRGSSRGSVIVHDLPDEAMLVPGVPAARPAIKLRPNAADQSTSEPDATGDEVVRDGASASVGDPGKAVVLDSTGIHVIQERTVAQNVPPGRESSGQAVVLDSKGLHTVSDAAPSPSVPRSLSGTGEAPQAKGAVAAAIRNIMAAEAKGVAGAIPAEAPQGPKLGGPLGGSGLGEAVRDAPSLATPRDGPQVPGQMPGSQHNRGSWDFRDGPVFVKASPPMEEREAAPGNSTEDASVWLPTDR